MKLPDCYNKRCFAYLEGNRCGSIKYRSCIIRIKELKE